MYFHERRRQLAKLAQAATEETCFQRKSREDELCNHSEARGLNRYRDNLKTLERSLIPATQQAPDQCTRERRAQALLKKPIKTLTAPNDGRPPAVMKRVHLVSDRLRRLPANSAVDLQPRGCLERLVGLRRSARDRGLLELQVSGRSHRPLTPTRPVQNIWTSGDL